MYWYIKSFLLIVMFVGISNSVQAQQEIAQKRIIKSGVIIKSTPFPFLFETSVGGNMEIKQEGLSFTPLPCGDKDKKVSSVFPCNSYLINQLNLRFEDVVKIRRRNYLFLFPNRVLIRKTNGENYLFTTYRRKALIDAYNQYKMKKTSISVKQLPYILF